MTTHAPSPTLLQLLSQEVEHAVSLLEALRTEHQALTDNNAEAIENSVKTKQQQLERFEKSEGVRKQWLKRAGVDESGSAITDYLKAQNAEGEQLLSLWNQLLEIARQCREQNQTNGALVEVHRRHVQRALHLLRGTQEPPTYGPSGEARDQDGSHSLAKA